MDKIEFAAVESDEYADVVLLNMPFAPLNVPSAGLHLLAQCLKREGITARVLYPSAAFAESIGETAYRALSRGYISLLPGEWIFSRHVCPVGEVDDYVAFMRRRLGACGCNPDALPLPPKVLPEVITAANRLIDDLVVAVMRLRPRVVGFGSLFHQHLACLAAARRLKEAARGVFTVIGGANCNGAMGIETLRQFSFVDAVVSGPGEIALIEMTRQLLAGERPSCGPGVHVRSADGSVPDSLVPGPAPEGDLDLLPLVDYHDYFSDPLARAFFQWVPVETSRGCWWGQKNHCVFCSENGDNLRYRMKSPDRIVSELIRLSQLYPNKKIVATDEILAPAVIDQVMPRLAALPGRRDMFFSIKSNIQKRQLMALAAAGTTVVQPGIESLDDEILGPMRKGVSALGNVQTLKWCRELGLQASYTILVGFPFDRPQAFKRMAALVPLLTHLAPPFGLGQVNLQRFSPLYMEAERYGINIVPSDAYRYIYPFSDEKLQRLAYNFDFTLINPQTTPDDLTDLRREIRLWIEAGDYATLFYSDEDGHLFINDTRPAAVRRFHVLTGLDRDVLLACDGILSPANVLARLNDQTILAEEVALALTRLVSKRLMIENNGLFLSLPLQLEPNFRPPAATMMAFLSAKSAYLASTTEFESHE